MSKAKIKHDPNNARVHDEPNKGAIKKSLQELGTGRVINGAKALNQILGAAQNEN